MAELTGKTIAELPEVLALGNNDLIPLMSSASSKRITGENLRNSLFRIDQGVSASGMNIDELLAPGTYYVTTPSSVTGNVPPTAYAYKLVVVRIYPGDSPRLWQIAYNYHPNCVEYRRRYDGENWGDWKKVIGEDDIAPLQSRINEIGGGIVSTSSLTIATGEEKEIPMANSSKAFLIVNGYTTNLKGAYIVFTSSEGTVSTATITEASTLTFETEANKLIVTNTSQNYSAYCLLVTY